MEKHVLSKISSFLKLHDLFNTIHRLREDNGIVDAVPQWLSSYLTDQTQYVSLSIHCSAFAPVHSGVPQDSVQCPMLFAMNTKPLTAFIDSHSIIHH